jgi:hypothetical protein
MVCIFLSFFFVFLLSVFFIVGVFIFQDVMGDPERHGPCINSRP